MRIHGSDFERKAWGGSNPEYQYPCCKLQIHQQPPPPTNYNLSEEELIRNLGRGLRLYLVLLINSFQSKWEPLIERGAVKCAFC